MPDNTGSKETGIHPSKRTLVDADADAGNGGVNVKVGHRGASRAIFRVIAVARMASCMRAYNGTRRLKSSRVAGIKALADAVAGAKALDDADANGSAAASNSIFYIGPESL